MAPDLQLDKLTRGEKLSLLNDLTKDLFPAAVITEDDIRKSLLKAVNFQAIASACSLAAFVALVYYRSSWGWGFICGPLCVGLAIHAIRDYRLYRQYPSDEGR